MKKAEPEELNRHLLVFELFAEWEALVDDDYPFECVIGVDAIEANEATIETATITTIDVTTLNIGGTEVTSTAAELNFVDVT